MHPSLTKSHGRVVAVPAMILPEIPERKAVQVPAVGGIAKGAEIGIVRCHDNHFAAGSQQPVEFFHCAENVRDMFYDMDCPDFAK